MELIFATQNQNKTKELTSIFPKNITLKSLQDIGLSDLNIEETGSTFQENALIKAQAIYLKVGTPTFAEDSGLVVNALNGSPGIYSARFAGLGATPEENNQKLLQELIDQEDRSAYFIAVVALYDGEETHYFEGRCHGTIAFSPSGTEGFGYDPIFIPDGYHQTFAEIGLEEKNKISHRAKAIEKFINFLERLR